ncbi:MAG: 4Fe-4S dicluster domain-containing protein [Steroidobacteraceae bacterium]
MNESPSGLDLLEPDTFLLERRRVLKLMAASAALAAGACSGPPEETIVPYVRAPEEELPGKPLFYASSVSLSGYAMGVLVETNGGRPTKVEGNLLHPASLGATDVFAQAAVLQLWDPARSQTLLHQGRVATWPEFLQVMEGRLRASDRGSGAGLCLLTGNVCSPTLQWQLEQFRERYPQARWYQYDPLHRDCELKGSELAFGRALDTRYRFDHARALLTLDADFLSCAPTSVRYARDLIALRNPDRGVMSRIYAVESFPGLIGAKADHRLALAPGEIQQFVLHLAKALGVGPSVQGSSPAPAFEAAVIADFQAHPGESLIVPGRSVPPQLHALVHILNHRLGGLGKTFEHSEPVAFAPAPHLESIRALAEAMAERRVQMLVILEGNPAYDAPADLDFAARLRSVPHSVHLSPYVDETSAHCTWHVPAAHAFEQWSDARAFDGTANIVQPVIAPLYGGHSVHELMSVLLRSPNTTAYEAVHAYWQRVFNGTYGEDSWHKALRDGLIAGTTAPAVSVSPRSLSPAIALPSYGTLVANFVPDQSMLDGRFANNAWLHELPRSMSKLTWDNAAYLSPRTAGKLAVKTGDEIEVRRGSALVRAGVWVLPGHADECITLPLGYGRTRAGPVSNGLGFDAYRLRTLDAPWHADVQVRRTGGDWLLVTTQHHAQMEGRKIIRRASAEEFARNPGFATAEESERVPDHTLYPDYPHDSYQWGMVIDLNACIGCNACTIACQAENNIPVVGKEEVHRGREMHWIRIDRYYREAGERLDTEFQPIPCMHCERAPCEVVCPVEASVHDAQGLNVQVYNRCVGTRFCSNNCPYKVRRFNFLQYSNLSEESLKALQNPDVTVRQRGVMEKCTYCVQRIQRGRIEAEQLGRRIQDGEVVTACQAVCPTQAITFGDINDPASQVHQLKASPRNYALLAQLNTRPRTTYLAEVTNSKTGVDTPALPRPGSPPSPDAQGSALTGSHDDRGEM